jgi:hypothetical protein
MKPGNLSRLTSLLNSLALSGASAALPSTGLAQSSDELARQLANPVANLISVPLQSNWDRNIGPREDAWSFVLQAEATYDWEREDASVPVGMFVGKVFRIGGQTVQVLGGPRYYASHFDNGPKGWGARLAITLLFPR